jgi:hypothetical protein
MLSNDQMRSVIVQSILNHAKHYAVISGGNSLHDNGIEQSICYSVASDIFKSNKYAQLSNISVILELSSSEFDYWCVGKSLRGRKPENLLGRERIDITVFDSSDCIKGIIEMKRWMQYSVIKNDIARIESMLKRYGEYSLKWGCVAFPFYIWKKGDKELKSGLDIIGGICGKIAENFNSLKCSFKYREISFKEKEKCYDEEKKYRLIGVGAGCIMLKRK